MKIPKYRDIDPELRKMDSDDLFDLLMCDFATHDIKSVITDLVIYIKKSGFDLSKELLDLSKHPDNYDLAVHVARKLCRIQNRKFFDRLHKQMHAHSKSSIPSSSFIPESTDKSTCFRDDLIKFLKSHDFDSLDLVGVTQDGGILDLGCNSIESAGLVDLGLDSLKFKLINHILSNEGRDRGTGSSGFSSGNPDKPTPENPVDQAVDILNNLGL